MRKKLVLILTLNEFSRAVVLFSFGALKLMQLSSSVVHIYTHIDREHTSNAYKASAEESVVLAVSKNF